MLVLLAGVSALDQVEAETHSRDLEFYLRRLDGRVRVVDVSAVRDAVRRRHPALIFLHGTSDSDLAAAGLAGSPPASSFPSVHGAPLKTLVFTVGLDAACAGHS